MAAERLSTRLERMSASCATETVTLREILREMGEGDHAFVTLVASVCFMHPIPMPGLSWGLGAIIVIAGYRLARGKGLWLPSRLLDRPVKSQIPVRVFGFAARALRKVEGLIKPRFLLMTKHSGSAQAHGAAIVTCGVLILVPLPPPTNFPPAGALLLLSLGILEADGLLLSLGYLGILLTLAMFTAISVLGWNGVQALIG